jgi:PAP2 superfamily
VWPTVVLELAVVGGLLFAYQAARLPAGHSSAIAYDNARNLLTWERALRLPHELAVQQLLLTSETITRIANLYYATVHFPLTGAFLVWLFVRSRDHYYRIRTSLALLTALALLIHAAFPLAPARMLQGRGFVDTASTYGPTVYNSPETDNLTNQFAAMPSLHFGWAVMVALGVIRASRSRYRWFWITHPAATLLIIVGTGNHYWLDAAAAGGLIVVAEYSTAAWCRAVVPLAPGADVVEWRGFAGEWRSFGGEWRKSALNRAKTARSCATRLRTTSRAPPAGRQLARQ